MCKRRVGYTLIEVLVVVAVIGVLAALLMPVINSFRERAVTTSCLSNLRQLGMGFIAYSSDEKNRGFFPHEDRDSLPIGSSMDAGNYCWFDRIDAYMGTANLSKCKQCPAWEGALEVDSSGLTEDKHSYKMNSRLEEGIDKNPKTGGGSPWPSNPAAKEYYFFPPQRVKNPGSLVLLFDGRTDTAPLDSQPAGYEGYVDHQRHSGVTNVNFCDGATRTIDGGEMGVNAAPNGWSGPGTLIWDPWS